MLVKDIIKAATLNQPDRVSVQEITKATNHNDSYIQKINVRNPRNNIYPTNRVSVQEIINKGAKLTQSNGISVQDMIKEATLTQAYVMSRQ